VESPHDHEANTQRLHLKNILIAGGSVVVYALVFVPLYWATGTIAASLSVVPIALAGWLFGKRGGLLASLLSIPLHVLLFTLGGADGWQVVLQEWPGSVMGAVVGVAAGWLGEFLRHVQRQSRELAQERAALRAEIARRELVEYELQQARLNAEAANRAKSTFLTNVSHELRTPLTGIIGYSDLLSVYVKRGDLTHVRRDIEKIRNAGHQLLTVINDILDLSKIEAGKMEVLPEAFELPPLIREVADTVHPLLVHQGNRLDIRHISDEDVVYMDRAKLRQVLLNLLNNAARFTTGGMVTLEIERETDEAAALGSPITAPVSWHVFRVSDTGIGMSDEQIARLFQPFTQAERTTTRDYGGTGLGLALCQRFCELMGGTITVSSRLGIGTTFTARLPNVATDHRSANDER
jgi:signal transduction histidine kinase